MIISFTRFVIQLFLKNEQTIYYSVLFKLSIIKLDMIVRQTGQSSFFQELRTPLEAIGHHSQVNNVTTKEYMMNNELFMSQRHCFDQIFILLNGAQLFKSHCDLANLFLSMKSSTLHIRAYLFPGQTAISRHLPGPACILTLR